MRNLLICAAALGVLAMAAAPAEIATAPAPVVISVVPSPVRKNDSSTQTRCFAFQL